MITFSLSLAALLLAAPAQGKPSADAAAMQAEAAAAEKAADSAASAAQAANKAADAAAKAADAAARAADAAEKAAESAMKAAQNPPPATVAVVAAPAAAPVVPPAPPPPDVVYTSVINLGMIALTGNAQSLAFNVGGNFQRKSPSWIVGAKGSASYGQTRVPATATAPETDQVTALAATFQLRGDRRLNQILSAYLLAGIDADHLKSIEERPYGEVGLSLTWFDVQEKGADKDHPDYTKTSLRTDLGFRYGREYRFQYYPSQSNLGEVDIVAPHLGVGFRYAVSREIIFTDDVDVTANVEGDARLLLVNTAKLAARLTDTLNFAASFVVNYDSLPPAGKLSTDTALTVGVDIAL